MKPGKISINRMIREMFHLAGLHIPDGHKIFKVVGKFERAVRKDERRVYATWPPCPMSCPCCGRHIPDPILGVTNKLPIRERKK